jgi:hypothetical protein
MKLSLFAPTFLSKNLLRIGLGLFAFSALMNATAWAQSGVTFSEVPGYAPGNGDSSPGAIHLWNNFSNGWTGPAYGTAICVDPNRSYAAAGSSYDVMPLSALPVLSLYYPASAAEAQLAEARAEWFVDQYFASMVESSGSSLMSWLVAREVLREIFMDATGPMDFTTGSHALGAGANSMDPALPSILAGLSSVDPSYSSTSYTIYGMDPTGASGPDQSLIFVGAAVPEPTTTLLLGGLSLLTLRRRRKV